MTRREISSNLTNEFMQMNYKMVTKIRGKGSNVTAWGQKAEESHVRPLPEETRHINEDI